MRPAKVLQLPKNNYIPRLNLKVTKPYVPALDKYFSYVEEIFDRNCLTNGGPLLTELTERLKDFLGVNYLLIVTNGTSALQIAYKIKNLSNKKVITTPFTFPATSTALEWQNSKIFLADIEKNSWNLSAHACEGELKNAEISAIVPVNIFGMPCDLDAFDSLGKRYQIPIIYDSAQSLLTTYKNKSLFEYGDIHCVSFHATKLFHCVEGGALIFRDKSDYERAQKLINFGIDEHGIVNEPGINAKMSELHAAMGLCILDDIQWLIDNRQKSIDLYKRELKSYVEFQKADYDCSVPPMYMPIKLKNDAELLNVYHALNEHGCAARRYFYPVNHKYINNTKNFHLPINDQISNSILCLPLMHGLQSKHIKIISTIIKRVVA